MTMNATRAPLSALRLREDELPPDLILSIERILNIHAHEDADALDKLTNDFNPVPVLNEYFPDEAALGQMEAVQARLAQNERELQAEIDALREELRKDQDPSRMQLIQEMISDLLGQMSRIREKATESEAVVRNITREIQVLDLAKKNLILSMTTLKRLQMLVNVLSQLEDQIKERKYRDIVQSLAAVKQIGASFKPYLSVQRISQLWRRIQEIQTELRAMVDQDWDKFYMQDPAKPIKPSVVADACLVLDFVEKYVALELKEYRRIFRATDEAGQLDNLSRRTREGVPAEWKVGWFLTAKFIEITRDDMTLSVKQLLDTLAETMEFEAYISKRDGTPLREILKFATPSNASRPSKPITSAFETHMGVYIDAQDKILSDMLAQYRGAKSRSSLEATTTTTQDEDGEPPILCASLFTGQPLFDLCALFKKWLRIYAEEVLVASLRKPQTAMLAPRRSVDSRFEMSELKNACTLINTADYCQTTALELEENIREKCDEAFKEKITLQEERDLFVSAISAAIGVMLRELENSCDAPFSILSRTPWQNLKHVSGQSAYVPELTNAVEQVLDAVKPLVEQKRYLRNFFDKAASTISAKFTNALVRSRPLMEIGAEQLLIDLQAIKACLLKAPGEELSTSNYTKSVAKQTTRLEALLKVIVTPVDPPEGFILNYTLVIGDASFSNFQKILDLKGTPKATQNDLLDSFLTITSVKPELESTSFLSSLDMDPGLIANLTSPGSSRVSLIPGSATGESILAALSPPPLMNTPSGGSEGARADQGRREVFSDFKRFVSFGLRRETLPPS
ncbi:Vps53-like protein [Epithele typhae]|uniref:Vps53-like protein n=1 Tax=Epithele typhae TaxID=378194 RepID=UPI0020083C07|nr:Vps53-like protein [Epithele typhae]KAH9942364.1 Vps53-like protein [Epithele typhae]